MIIAENNQNSGCNEKPRIRCAIFTSETNPTPQATGYIPWSQFAQRLMKHSIRNSKLGAPMFGPYGLRNAGKRCNKDVEAITLLVVDSDHGVPINEVVGRFSGFKGVTYTTHSHTPEKPKCRVVLPLAAPIQAADYPAFIEGAKDRFGSDIFDEQASRNLSQAYYLPTCPPETTEHLHAIAFDGGFLDPAPLITRGGAVLAAKTPQKSMPARINDLSPELRQIASETAEEVERVKSALAAISADCDRGQWMRVCMAIRSTGWDSAEAIAGEWSRSAPEAFDPREFEKLWNSLTPDGGITLATLFHLAKQHGWADPKATSRQNIRETLNDAGNADRLLAAYGGHLRYVFERRTWLIWRQGHWHFDHRGAILEIAKAVARGIYQEAACCEDRDTSNALSKWANGSLQLPRLEAMEALSRPTLATLVTELDADPWILGVKNGLVNLRSGQFRAAQPEDLITRRANVEFDSSAICPIWQATIASITGGDRDLADFLQRAMGYSLTGDSREQVFFFAWGNGANGKTTVINVLREILADYAVNIQPEVLMFHRNTNSGTPTPEIARLAGARFVSAVETEDGQRLAESRMKQLTGCDAYTARFLHGTPFDFVPIFKLWIAGNHKPNIQGDDYGVWRRIVLVPFSIQIPEAQQDKGLPDKLRSEYPGVLNWLIEGCLAWQRHGLNPPASVRQEVELYKSEMDLVEQWLEERCNLDPTAENPARPLYRDFRQRLLDGGHTFVMTETKFFRKLQARGFEKRATNKGARYRGLSLKQGNLF